MLLYTYKCRLLVIFYILDLHLSLFFYKMNVNSNFNLSYI